MLLSPAEFPSPDARGFLLKLDGVSKTWKRRYCLLADAFLILYTDFDATSAIGEPSLLWPRNNKTATMSVRTVNTKLTRLITLFLYQKVREPPPIRPPGPRFTLTLIIFRVSASLCLHGYRVQSTGGLSGSKRHAFELIPPDMAASLSSTHAELKNFYFVAETETEKKR